MGRITWIAGAVKDAALVSGASGITGDVLAEQAARAKQASVADTKR